ncbi:MAG: histone deacetylase family protein [Hyphomicrobiaceae bacterium]
MMGFQSRLPSPEEASVFRRYDMKDAPFYYPDTPEIPLPAGHRFPAGKYRLLRERAVSERLLGRSNLLASPLASREQLLSAHAEVYVDAVIEGSITPAMQKRIGLPWSQTLVTRSRAAVGGSLAAARSALKFGLSGQLAGGTHHAHHDFGSGFCVFNDLAVTARVLLQENLVGRIAILDLDVHQGDGNASLLTSDKRVFVVSIHGEKNFPFRKVPSDLDIALPDGTGDKDYCAAVRDALPRIASFQPDLLLYISGADPLKADRLGRLALTLDGLMARDLLVFEFLRNNRLPVSFAMGGGYADPVGMTVEGYANTLRCARSVFEL